MSNQNIKNIVKTELDGIGTIVFLFVFGVVGEVCYCNGITPNSKSNDAQIKKQTKIMSQQLDVTKKQCVLDSLRYYNQKTR